jgi:hypothetical protein
MDVFEQAQSKNLNEAATDFLKAMRTNNSELIAETKGRFQQQNNKSALIATKLDDTIDSIAKKQKVAGK